LKPPFIDRVAHSSLCRQGRSKEGELTYGGVEGGGDGSVLFHAEAHDGEKMVGFCGDVIRRCCLLLYPAEGIMTGNIFKGNKYCGICPFLATKYIEVYHFLSQKEDFIPRLVVTINATLCVNSLRACTM
jgi:hypothetical protein